MLLIGTVGLLIGIDVAFAVVTVLVVEAIENVGFEMLVTVEGSVLPLPVITGTDDERVMVLLGVKTLLARSFICEKTPGLAVAGVKTPNFDVGGIIIFDGANNLVGGAFLVAVPGGVVTGCVVIEEVLAGPEVAQLSCRKMAEVVVTTASGTLPIIVVIGPGRIDGDDGTISIGGGAGSRWNRLMSDIALDDIPETEVARVEPLGLSGSTVSVNCLRKMAPLSRCLSISSRSSLCFRSASTRFLYSSCFLKLSSSSSLRRASSSACRSNNSASFSFISASLILACTDERLERRDDDLDTMEEADVDLVLSKYASHPARIL